MKNKKILIIVISAVLAVCLAVFGIIVLPKIIGGNSDAVLVKFDVNTDLETNVLQDREIKIGRRVSQPKAFITGNNPTNLQVYGWYTSKDCKPEERWDFKNNTVEGKMTLYAKWVELYDVNYYVNGEICSTTNVFKGDLVTETAEFVEGHKYLGSYTTADYTEKFDFTKPATGKTDIYIKRSEGIYLSDSVEEGLLSSGNLTNYLTAACGSYPAGTEDGWVEEYVIAETGEKCTYVNFGLTPVYADSYVELSLNLDISQSQTIKITYKNLGPATTMTCYFTAMLDENTYSETGAQYSQHFCWPNWEGSSNQPIPIRSNMSENDEWRTVELNLYEIYKNGYSIWGTSPYLGAIRIQVGYVSDNEDDWSNEMLIKSIEGIPEEIIVEDTDDIKEMMVEASETELESAGSGITIEDGVSFVKDHAGVTAVTSNAEVYKTTEGLLFYAENEVEARKNNGASAGFTILCPEGRPIDMGELTTLSVTLRNFGYGSKLIAFVYNDQGVPVKTDIEIGQRMPNSKEYVVNLYGEFGMEGKFSKIEFSYNSVGVDNLILFEQVRFTPFVPYDSVGINFNDKNSYGFESNEQVEVSFDSKSRGIKFNVQQSGAVVTSPDKSYDSTNEGYANISVKYNMPSSSNITKVIVQFKVNGAFGTSYEIELDTKGKTVTSDTVNLNIDEGGYVKAVRLTFEGTGSIVINEIIYGINETSLPFYESYSSIYATRSEWKGEENFYEHDSKEKYSTFIKGANLPSMSPAIYIGYSSATTNFKGPHTTKNILISGRTTVTLVYQNTTAKDKLSINLAFDVDESSPGDGSKYLVKSYNALNIDSNMGDYEWSAVSVVIEGGDFDYYNGSYLAKFWFTFEGEEISIRVIAVNVEA